MRYLIGVVIVAFFTIGTALRPARGEITAEAVREAIDRGVKFLERKQLPDGSWGEYGGGSMRPEPGGLTSLCTLALLSCGVPPDDPHIERALQYIRKFPTPGHTYATSLQTMVLCRANPQRDRLQITANVKWLQAAQSTRGKDKGGWTYDLDGGTSDNSNTQFAILALYEAERVGIPVSSQTWRLAKAHWEESQFPDGSWPYKPGEQMGTGSMTCAGIASLAIAADRVGGADARVDGDQISCCETNASDDHRVQRALKWLGDHFSVSHNAGWPHQQIFLLYYLYGIERTGRMTARRFIGDHDWYREGAEFLVRMKGGPLQDSWRGVGAAESNEAIATSFALLFLSKGRWPVLLSKVKHGRGNDWNRHRSDVANLTRYVESKWRMDFVWQVVDIDAASVEDLTQSPVLYYCGANSPLPDDAKAQEELAHKIRDYLDRGGFLFAEGYCGGAAFDEGFRKLMLQVFPEPEYRLGVLPPEHPIWRMDELVDPSQLRRLEGIEFGCRTSVVYCPALRGDPSQSPLSCLWEISRGGREVKYSPVVQKQIDGGLSLGINVLAYATNRGAELKYKDPVFPTTPGAKKADSARGRLQVVNLRHPGGCSAAPRALASLLDAAATTLKIRVTTDPIELPITDEGLFDYHMAFMHGRNAFRLTDAERKQLKLYIERGGILFANSICASKAFTESFRREMEAIFPKQPLQAVPKDDPLLTTFYGGFDLSSVTRRDPQEGSRKGRINALQRKSPPELEGIKLGKRYGVIFSSLDLSCALEKQDTMECRGYSREDAARIGLNVLLYSLHP